MCAAWVSRILNHFAKHGKVWHSLGIAISEALRSIVCFVIRHLRRQKSQNLPVRQSQSKAKIAQFKAMALGAISPSLNIAITFANAYKIKPSPGFHNFNNSTRLAFLFCSWPNNSWLMCFFGLIAIHNENHSNVTKVYKENLFINFTYSAA